MSAAHTPGPWFTGEFLANVYFGNANGELIAQCGGFKFKQKPEGESEANARLITASPEMLEALQEAEILWKTGLLNSAPGQIQKVTDLRKAAISKALGEPS